MKIKFTGMSFKLPSKYHMNLIFLPFNLKFDIRAKLHGTHGVSEREMEIERAL